MTKNSLEGVRPASPETCNASNAATVNVNYAPTDSEVEIQAPLASESESVAHWNIAGAGGENDSDLERGVRDKEAEALERFLALSTTRKLAIILGYLAWGFGSFGFLYVCWMYGSNIVFFFMNAIVILLWAPLYLVTFPLRLIMWLMAVAFGQTDKLRFGLGWGWCPLGLDLEFHCSQAMNVTESM